MNHADIFGILPTKHPDENALVTFDFTELLENRWKEDSHFALNDYARALTRRPFEYQVTRAGRTGRKEPIWPNTVGQTIDDGEVEWTAVALSTNAIDTITTETITGSDDLTIGIATVASPLVQVSVTDGFAARDYDIKCVAATAGGRQWVAIGRLPVRA